MRKADDTLLELGLAGCDYIGYWDTTIDPEFRENLDSCDFFVITGDDFGKYTAYIVTKSGGEGERRLSNPSSPKSLCAEGSMETIEILEEPDLGRRPFMDGLESELGNDMSLATCDLSKEITDSGSILHTPQDIKLRVNTRHQGLATFVRSVLSNTVKSGSDANSAVANTPQGKQPALAQYRSKCAVQ